MSAVHTSGTSSTGSDRDQGWRGTGARVQAVRFGVLALIFMAALVHVPFPFWGDQALFASAAHGMRHGDRLYVDFWDYKQPGIYLWYLVAGTVFGFRQSGIHFAELLWSVVFALCLQRMMRARVRNRWVAEVAPVFTVGAFYAATTGWDLTQIEWLVAFPLALSLWAAADAGDGPERSGKLLLSGVAASAVVYFKLVYVLIPIAFWGYLLLERHHRLGHEEDTRNARAHDESMLLGGLAVPLLPLLAYFVVHRLLGTMWWTYVTYPPKVVRSIDPVPFSRLREGVQFFVQYFAWLTPLALFAFSTRRRRADRRRDLLVAGLVIWFVLGFATVVIQNEWQYQFMLPLVPLGLLAVYGLDDLCTSWRAVRARRRAAGAPAPRLHRTAVAILLASALLALFPAKEVVHKVKSLAADDFALTASGHAAFDDTFAPYYPTARAAAAFLSEPGREPGPIHVEGNPLIQYLSGRPAALKEHGWAPEQSDARLWRWTREELRAQRPVYLWIDQFSDGIMRERSPDTLAEIHSLYCPVETIGDGTWYARHGSRECRAGS